MIRLLRHSFTALVVLVATTTLVQADVASFRGYDSAIQQYNQHQWDRRLNAADQQAAAEKKANEIGASVRKAVKQLRGGNDKFYHDLITAVKITMCEQLVTKNTGSKNPSTRFVPASDENAYKYDNGTCIKIQVVDGITDDKVKNAYAQGNCEVKPNCYWGPFNDTDVERQPVYSTKEGTPAPDGAMTAVDAKAILQKWAQGMMVFVVPGIILAALSLLTMIFFLICRCCCNRCGGRSPKEGGYTCMQKFYPLFFFLLFSVGVIAVAGIALLYQKTVTSAVSDTFVDISDTLTNAHGWVVNVSTPLEHVRDKVVDSADQIKVQLAGSDFIEAGIDGVTTQLELFGSYSADRTLPNGCTLSSSEPFCVPCQACTTISTKVGQSTQQMRDHAGDGIAKLKSVRSSLNTMLVDIADSVKNTVNSAVDKANQLTSTIDTTKNQVVKVQKQYENQKGPQQAAVLGLFAFSLVVIALGFIGILFGLTPLKFLANIIHLAYVIGFLALFFTFLLSAILLAVSVILGDVCEVTTILSQDWRVALGEPAKGINACFKNESLIDTFDLSSSLEFARGGIQFPSGTNLTAMLDFSNLDSFASTIQATNAGTFDTSAINSLLAVVNTYAKQSDNTCTPNDVYTLANILTPWTANGETQSGSQTGEDYITNRYTNWDSQCTTPGNGADFACNTGTSSCTFSVFMKQAYHNVSMLAMVERDSGQFITDLHTNMTKVTDYTAAFKTNTTHLDTNIKSIQTDLEGSLIQYVDDFEHAMYCTFIADGYDKLYEALCGKLMPAFTMISLMLFLAGVFLFPVNVCLIIAVKRLKAKGNGSHVMDTEMKFK